MKNTTDNNKNVPNDAKRFANTERDEETTGLHKSRKTDPALADEDQPGWQPPESVPEPRPADPIMNSSSNSHS